MSIRVEFFGIPRRRAGVAAIDVEADTLGELIRKTGRRLPELADECFDGDALKPGFVSSINAVRFTTDPTEPLANEDHVMILSADAGG